MSGVYGFGDKLPSGDDEDLFVSHSVKGFPGGMLSGPYKSLSTAESERDDIAGYEGVYDARIVKRKHLIGK